MKPIQFAKFLVLALAVTVAAAGCKKTPVKVTEIPGQTTGTMKLKGQDKPIVDVPAGQPAHNDEGPIRGSSGDNTGLTGVGRAPGSIPGGPGNTGPGTGLGATGADTTATKPKPPGDDFPPVTRVEGGVEKPEILEKQSVYFDFDSSAVKASERSKIGPVAEYLKSNPTHKIRIYGNCDERGTEEYNRSLGERRALALRSGLLGEGVESDRIDTVTNGKDKPRALGHDDASWRENRRGDFGVLLPSVAP